MKSILQETKECFLTGREDDLHCHHVFGGPNRKLSEQYGLKIWLTGEMHMSDKGIHFNKALDTEVKEWAQKKAMEHYGWSIADFRARFGKSYV